MVRCVLARDDIPGGEMAHSEHVFASVPAYGDTISILQNGKSEIFFVTGIMHCAAGSIPSEIDPIASLTISREPPQYRGA